MASVQFLPKMSIGTLALGLAFTPAITLPANAECVNAIYHICPNPETAQTIPVGTRTVLVDTVVEELKDVGKWKYNWCLKAQGKDTSEFWVHWEEIGLDSKTSCGGFIGISIVTSRPPAVPKRTKVHIGSDRKPIYPNIVVPRDPVDSFIPKEPSGTYVTEFVIPSPEQEHGKEDSSTTLTLVSSYERISPEEVSYKISYTSDNLKNQSQLSFRLSDVATSRSKVINQKLPVHTKEGNVLRFTSADAPENLITYLTVFDVEGKEVGSAPVSLAVPVRRGS